MGAARAAHTACCRILAALTRCYEAQIVGILLMDFCILLMCGYLSVLLMLQDFAQPGLLLGCVINGTFSLVGTYLLARTCHLAAREVV